MSTREQQLEKEVGRLTKSLKYLIAKVHSAAKEIQTEVKCTGTSNAAKRVADHALLLEAAAICAETVFKPQIDK